MILLPIVDRELRLALRRRSTRRVCWWSALIAVLTGFGGLALLSLGAAPSGNPLFMLLSWYAFALCIFAGVFVTADAISEERREGTLGLLFLTGLKGYEVVLGKFFARSLSAFYGLLALLPILGLPLLVGGVTGGEFWRMALALSNVLFYSLCVGMFISVWARSGSQAMAVGCSLIALQLAGLHLLIQFAVPGRQNVLASLITLINPAYAFYLAPDANYTSNPAWFQSSLAGSHLLGWILLAAASLTVARIWRNAGEFATPGLLRRKVRLPWRNQRRRRQRRERMLERNPVYWLIAREGARRWPITGVVLIWGVVLALWSLSLFWQGASRRLYDFWYPIKGAGLVVKILMAVQACRFFSEGRRNGVLEMLLATPLRNREILRGHWLGLRSCFLFPALAFVLLSLIPIAIKVAGQLHGAGPSLTSAYWELVQGMLVAFWIGLGLVLDIWAVSYVGAWLALSMKKPQWAAAATILFVLIIPSIGFCGLDLLIDLFLILWASTNLSQDLRWIINKPYQQPVRIPPRTLAGPAPTPPVIRKTV